MMNDTQVTGVSMGMVELDAQLARDVRALTHFDSHHARFTSELRARLLQQADDQRKRPVTARHQRGTPPFERSLVGWLWLHLARRHRPVAAAIALAGTLVIVGGAYAALSLVDEAMSAAPGLATVVQHYGQPLNLAQSACGYTMTVTRAYADANRVVVGYTLGGHPSRHYVSLKSDWPAMTDARGAALPHVDMGMSRSLQEGTGGHFAAFDTSAIVSDARPLHLHLTLPSITMVEKMDGTELAATPCETYSGHSETILDGQGGAIRVRDVRVDKPLSFDLTVPVDPARRVVEPRQTVPADGGAVTLERLVVTRSEARIYLRADRPNLIQPDALVTLTVGGLAAQGVPVYWKTTSDGLDVFTVARPLYESAGEWTLAVRANPYRERKETGGPWEFRVTVPQGATR